MTSVRIVDPNTKEVFEYYMDDREIAALNNKVIPELRKQDNDYVMIIDGPEGSGKSTKAFQVARFVDPEFCLENVCINVDEFRRRIVVAKNGSAIVFDEAYRGFGASGALTEVNRVLKGMMMEMRQKNLLVIIVLPTFYMLDRYVALFRAKTLIHITKRGYCHIYNKRKILRLYQHPTAKRYFYYGHVKTAMRCKFFGKYAINEEKYRAKKLESFKKEFRQTRNEKYKEQRDKLITIISKEYKLTLRKMETLLKKHNFKLSFRAIGEILSKNKDNRGDGV